MPEMVSFRISAYYKLVKGETGLTSAQTVRIPASAAIDFILDHLPEEAVTVTHGDGPDGLGHVTTTVTDWNLVPAGIRNPNLLARRK